MASELCFNEAGYGDGGWNIGESCVPICWNYTARYRQSGRYYRASGSGAFPATLNVPGNVDASTGVMIDDGVFIDPDEYRIY